MKSLKLKKCHLVRPGEHQHLVPKVLRAVCPELPLPIRYQVVAAGKGLYVHKSNLSERFSFKDI